MAALDGKALFVRAVSAELEEQPAEGAARSTDPGKAKKAPPPPEPEIVTIVVENGSDMIKAGFGGDDSPHAVSRSFFLTSLRTQATRCATASTIP